MESAKVLGNVNARLDSRATLAMNNARQNDLEKCVWNTVNVEDLTGKSIES